MSTSEDHHGVPKTPMLSKLEEELEAVTLELTSVRNQQDKQRKELETLLLENDLLCQQKEQRTLRKQLNADFEDLSKNVEKKLRIQQQREEGLEQMKTRHRQLKRTLDLLQGGVQNILEKSAQDDPQTEQAKLRAQQRQEALKRLVGNGAFQMLHNMRNHASWAINDSEDDEDEEIHEDEGNHDIRLFAHKKRSKARLDSIESIISTISDSSPPAPARTSWSASTSSGVSHQPASRANPSSRSRSRSRSKGRRKKKNASLVSKLETGDRGSDDLNDEGSADTPRTCNTDG